MNTELKNKQKEEAIKCLKRMGIIADAIKQFKNDDQVMSSEAPMGALYWLSEEQEKFKKDFEEKYNSTVYFVIRSRTTFGMMDSYFYVSDCEEEWEDQYGDLENNEACVYVHNVDDDMLSEFGYIGFEPRCGGAVRTY